MLQLIAAAATLSQTTAVGVTLTGPRLDWSNKRDDFTTKMFGVKYHENTTQQIGRCLAEMSPNIVDNYWYNDCINTFDYYSDYVCPNTVYVPQIVTETVTETEYVEPDCSTDAGSGSNSAMRN